MMGENALSKGVSTLSGIGEKRLALYHKLEVFTLDDLLRFYPRAYEDWSCPTPIAETVVGETACVRACLTAPVSERRLRQGMVLYTFFVSDGAERMRVTLFNNRYLANLLRVGEDYLFYGKIGGDLVRREMSAPAVEPADKGAVIRPVYRQTEGLSSRLIAAAVVQALRAANNLDDPLPEALRQAYGLCDLSFALHNIHFPASAEALDAARKRLIFEELFYLELGLQMRKNKVKHSAGCVIIHDDTEAFFARLPFAPTGAQRRAVGEAMGDLMGTAPMNRLLQGDVGAGKTAVAAALAYTVAKNGFQAAMMAPTEILAEQHYRSFTRMLAGSGLTAGLLTGSTSAGEKRRIRGLLADGGIDLIIGTHALLEAGVAFKRLGFVITDEQHRFGVEQRAALYAKGANPHLLVMSATPIPRTLALILYGDLDISVLDEMPPGRQPVATYAVSGRLRPRVYRYIETFLKQGRQGYIVCPLVEDNPERDDGLNAAETYAKNLAKTALADYRIGVLHGRMKPAEKERVMRAFASGEIQLLVSTTVIEVGVDVPNAVIMVIENAERFGLSQLHQLRGRVGRGEYSSACVLISDAQNPETKSRLRILCETNDGFRIADEDLKLRGPGDFFGSRQHGLPELRIADMMTDMDAMKSAGAAARVLLRADPALDAHPFLQGAVEGLFRRVTEGGFN